MSKIAEGIQELRLDLDSLEASLLKIKESLDDCALNFGAAGDQISDSIEEVGDRIANEIKELTSHILILTATIEQANKGQGQDCKGGCDAKR